MAEKKVDKKYSEVINMHQILNTIPHVYKDIKLPSKLSAKIIDAVFCYDDYIEKYKKEESAAQEKLKPTKEVFDRIVQYESLKYKESKNSLTEEEKTELKGLIDIIPVRNKYNEEVGKLMEELSSRVVKVKEVKFSSEEFKSISDIVIGMEYVETPVANKMVQAHTMSFLSLFRKQFVL